ncbi:MAG TPA: AtpZ/AtpI family protein [Nitrospiria bacterium]|jgi:ATP synthase protein I
MKSEQDEFRKGLSFASRIGAELVASTAVGGGLGYFLDRFLNTSPWIMVAGLLLGGVAGMLSVYRFVNRDQTK